MAREILPDELWKEIEPLIPLLPYLLEIPQSFVTSFF
jgi:hypothetical protein